ncbi:unnamed protein product [Dovyalis caffra]|uniref:Nudix hydrolase domain-containing protein n=1 Tax=Dovyalis caffra TaxID=77055 RepID=A0AAV1RJ78_9ROSI|nr:unnamed protein product [Dovyalis caffra]
MSELVARTGRLQQRYEGGCRLVAGCIPYRFRGYSEDGNANSAKAVEVLMINSSSGPGLLFPKGGWENDETAEEAAVREAIEEAGVRGDLMDVIGYYQFKSKTHQDDSCPEGLCKAAMYALFVKEELESWPEQSTRTRRWLTIPEAVQSCRHKWMEDALKDFSIWLAEKM